VPGNSIPPSSGIDSKAPFRAPGLKLAPKVPKVIGAACKRFGAEAVLAKEGIGGFTGVGMTNIRPLLAFPASSD